MSGRSAAWLARLLWEQEVGGSNPPVPTIIRSELQEVDNQKVSASSFSGVLVSIWCPLPSLLIIATASEGALGKGEHTA
jgi:hypothetical protein